MPSCKICGKPVVSTPVMHSGCWEMWVKEQAEKVCAYACKFAMICDSQGKLKREHCDQCALAEIVESSLCRGLEL